MSKVKRYLIILFFAFIACGEKATKFKSENIIFQATTQGNSVAGNNTIQLFSNKDLRICNSGGIGKDCYIGKYQITNDTISFFDLVGNTGLISDRFLIIRYSEQDSLYWKVKKNNEYSTWEDFKKEILSSNYLGEILPLDSGNNIIFEEYSLGIVKDSIK